METKFQPNIKKNNLFISVRVKFDKMEISLFGFRFEHFLVP